VSVWEILLLLLPFAAGWFWLDSLRARDLAIAEARRACAAEGLQFLDESVVGESIRSGRNSAGQLQIRRIFRFEFSDTGDNRHSGRVILLGQRVEAIHTKAASVTYLN
jgi:hypothetical protein